MIRTSFLAIVLSTSFAFFPVQSASAGVYRIESVVHGTTGGFGHTLFHAARNITSGEVLARFDATPGSSNYYHSNAGVLHFEGDLFSDAALTNQIGTVLATSNSLDGQDLGDGVWDGGLAGTIDFAFTFTDTSNRFHEYLHEQTGQTTHFNISINYLDRQYGGVEPLFANSLDRDAGLLTLWGADGDVSTGSFGPSILGSDIVFQLVPVPEPTGILIWAGVGVCLLLGRSLRRSLRE